jgi:di/tricarboxylate transporter
MEILLVLAILVSAVALFVAERFPIDLVAMMVLGALLVLGLVTPQEGISGFSNEATVTVAAMFVLSAGLQKTGAVAAVGRLLVRLGRNHLTALILVTVIVAGVSAFINNTAAVAVFIPLVLTLSARRKIAASRLLIPLSYASQFGGVCTLIGTSTNLLVSAISRQAGHGAFSMFEFSRMGLIFFVTGMVYFVIGSRWLLPHREAQDLVQAYRLGEYITELRVTKGSPLVGKTVVESGLGKEHDVTVLHLIRGKRKVWAPLRQVLAEGDVLLVRGQMAQLMELKDSSGLELNPEFKLKDAALEQEDLVLVQILVAPESAVAGHTLIELDFRKRFDALVLAIQRRGEALQEKLNTVRFEVGDLLLVMAPSRVVEKLRKGDDFIVLEEVEEPSMRKGKVPLVLAIIALVVALAAMNVMPILVTAILGCVALVLTRCIDLEEAYRAVDWRVIFLLAGILPLGIAMDTSGAAQIIADQAVALVGPLGPYAVLAVFYLLTAVLTETMSNNASAVLLAPIAIATGIEMGIDPRPLLMAVTFAASTSFATPVGYQTNAMVYNVGGYKYTDFMKVGAPLNLIFWALAVYFIPVFWPF